MTPTKQPSARLVSLLLCMTCLLWSCENRYAEEDQPGASESGDASKIPASSSENKSGASEGGDASKIPASPSGDQPGASYSGDDLEIPDPNPITSPTPSPSHEEALKRLKAMLTDKFIKKLRGEKLKEALRQLRDDKVGINDTVLLKKDEDVETTILHLVARNNGDVKLVKALMAAGADHKLDSRRNIPLHLAARKGHLDAVGIILSKMDKNDSEVNTKNKKKQTPLDEANFRLNACEGSNEELSIAKKIIELLKKNGAKTAAEIP